MAYVLTIGDQNYALADDVDITDLKSEVVRNVHSGGGWIAVHTAEHGTPEVFVSAGQPMILRER